MREWQRENNVGFFNIEKATDAKGVDEMGGREGRVRKEGQRGLSPERHKGTDVERKKKNICQRHWISIIENSILTGYSNWTFTYR